MMIGIGIPSSHSSTPRMGNFLLSENGAAEGLPLFPAGQLAGRVPGMADRAANPAFGLVHLAFSFEIAVAGYLAGFLLDRAGSLAKATLDALLVHSDAPARKSLRIKQSRFAA